MLAFLLLALPVQAAEVKAGEEYFLMENQTIEGNLYTAAGYVDISGTITGDLLTAGGSVIITGDVGEDLIVGGGDIDIWGNVGGDLRAVGGNVLVGGDVGGDVLVAGGMVQIRPNVTVGGDVIVAGGAVMISGSIKGKVKVAGGDIVMGGAIEGDVTVYYDESFEVIEASTFAANLKYRGHEMIEIPESVAVSGEVIFEKPEITAPKVKPMVPKPEKPWPAVLTAIALFLIIKVIIAMAVALFGVLAYPKRSQELVDHSIKHFGWELLRGFLVFIFAPVVILVLLLSMVGVLFGALAALVYGIMYIVAMVYSGVILGALIFKLFSKSKTYPVTWQSALVGIIVMHLIKLIPIVGWLFCAVFVLVALGAVANIGYHYFWLKRAK